MIIGVHIEPTAICLWSDTGGSGPRRLRNCPTGGAIYAFSSINCTTFLHCDHSMYYNAIKTMPGSTMNKGIKCESKCG